MWIIYTHNDHVMVLWSSISRSVIIPKDLHLALQGSGMWVSSCVSAECRELTLSALAHVGVRWKGFRLIWPAWELGQVTPHSSFLQLSQHRLFCSVTAPKGIGQSCLRSAPKPKAEARPAAAVRKRALWGPPPPWHTQLGKDITREREHTEAQLVSCLQACR